jgi:hypothetical protein
MNNGQHESIDSRVDDRAMDDFVAVARAKGDVSSRIAAIGLWNSKSPEDRQAYVDQNHNAVSVEKTQVTQSKLSSYKSKVDDLYVTLSGLVLKHDSGAHPTANDLSAYLTLPEKLQRAAYSVADKIVESVGRRTDFAVTFVEEKRKTLTFRRIDQIVGEYQSAIDENAGELRKARAKEYALEDDRNKLYENLLKFGDEFESCEKYLLATKKQLDLERERHKQGVTREEYNAGRDIGACVAKDLAPTQKRYDELAGKIRHTWVFLQYAKRNHASMRMAAHVLDQLDTRLKCDQEFLRDFRVRHTDIVDIDVPLRGLELVKKYQGFGQGIAEFTTGQDEANVDLLKLDIAPGYTFSTKDQARCEELSNALENVNGEVRNSVREIIDRARREAYGA